MLIKQPGDIRPSEITPPELYRQRRLFLKAGAALGVAAAAPGLLPGPARADARGESLGELMPSEFSSDEKLTPFTNITNYVNFYEFGTEKGDPARYAPRLLRTSPWTVTVEGHCEKPGEYAYEDIIAGHALEERIYRLRCVEAWSMVIPWVGIPMGDVLKRFEPTSNAKYVEFRTLHDPDQMPGQRVPILHWPYREGLRMDEAMHPLTIFAIGLYGRELPAQNGAPLRIVVPWKYGFKSIKSIVAIRFTEEQPLNSWQRSSPLEYGFYANVNPEISHPRWSQARERRIGDFFRRRTLPFNGYGEQVAHLYTGMDPRALF